MSGIARKDGVDTIAVNHPSCQTTTVTDQGSNNVFVNGTGVVRVGDDIHSHTTNPPSCPTHVTEMVNGSPTVFINGQPVARVGDAASCGATIITGSTNVFANS